MAADSGLRTADYRLAYRPQSVFCTDRSWNKSSRIYVLCDPNSYVFAPTEGRPILRLPNSSGTKYCPEVFALPTIARTHSLFHDNTHSNQPLADTYTHCVPIFKKTVTLIILILSFSCCISNLPFPVSTNLWSDSYEDMIDHHSYACNLSSCEIKAWIKFRPIPVQCSTNWAIKPTRRWPLCVVATFLLATLCLCCCVSSSNVCGFHAGSRILV